MSGSGVKGVEGFSAVVQRVRHWRDTYLTVASDDPVMRSRGHTLLWSLLFLTMANMSSLFSLWLIIPEEPALMSISLVEVLIQIVYFVGIWLARRGYVESGALLTSGLVGLSMLLGPLVYGGVDTIYFLSYLPLVLAAATLSPRKIVLTCLGHIVIGSLVFAYALKAEGQVNPTYEYMAMWGVMCLVLSAMGWLQATMMSRTFAEMSQMHEARQRLELEKTIAERDRLSALHHISEQESRAKSRFLATMSHELRTPLNAIIGYTELIQEEYEERAVDEDVVMLEELGYILSSGHHLLGLIDDVLDLARVEAGEMSSSREPFALHELLEECVATIRPMVQRGVELKLVLKPGAPETCVSDRIKVQQVLLNLLSNASKFTHKGEVRVVALMREDSHLEVRVEDTGIGIDPGDHELIFEAFKQADSSTTRAYDGTGLGLSLCMRLVEFLGGEIGVESTPGHGSTFWFTLPVERE
jgi:signal transduction histidine kinase